jgi:hypothetical protein
MRKKSWGAALACLVLVSVVGIPPALADTSVTMDGSLKTALLAAADGIDANGDGILTVEELEGVSGVLDLSSQGIYSLEGISHLTGVSELNVDDNWLNLSEGSADDLALRSLTGCAVNRGTQRIPVTELTLSAAEAELVPGETLTLTATVSPQNAADKTVLWTSDDTSVLTVTDGVVRAVAPGTTTVTASAQDGRVLAACNVVVKSTSLDSDIYTVEGGAISGVGKDTTVDELALNLVNSIPDITVYDEDGNVCESGTVSTGMTASLTIDGTLYDTASIVVAGDVNGDSAVDVTDYTLVRLHLLQLTTLTGDALLAADANEDGEVTISDYAAIRVDIAGLNAIINGPPDLSQISDTRIRQFLELALAQLGKPYVWGAEGPDEFDCSGFVYYCLTNTGGYTGRTIWRSTANTYSNWSYWPYVNRDSLQSGDLMFYFSDNPDDGNHIGHIGIYLGNGYHVHASSDNGRIVISRIVGWYDQMLSHGRRAYN